MRATDYIATASQIGLNERLDAKALGLSQYGSFDDGEDRAKTNLIVRRISNSSFGA